MAIKLTKINAVTLCGLVHGIAPGEEEMAPICQVTSRALRRSTGTAAAARPA